MSEKSISMCEGKGSLSHNNREFTAKNIDPSRTADNIVFVQQELGEAYHQLFDTMLSRKEKTAGSVITLNTCSIVRPARALSQVRTSTRASMSILFTSEREKIVVSALPMPR